MAGFQQVIIVGNVGKDPELKYSSSGVAVCSFSVAVTRKWSDRTTNETHEKTAWFKVSAWRTLAETCQQYLHKGSQVMVIGEIDVSAYSAQDGTPRASLELTAQNVQFLGQRGEQVSVGDADSGGGELPF